MGAPSQGKHPEHCEVSPPAQGEAFLAALPEQHEVLRGEALLVVGLLLVLRGEASPVRGEVLLLVLLVGSDRQCLQLPC